MKLSFSTLHDWVAESLNRPLFYVVPDANWAIGLETILPNYHIICAEENWTVRQLKAAGHRVFCAATDSAQPWTKRSASGLLHLPAVQAYIRQHAGEHQPWVMVFKPSPAVEKMAAHHGYRLIANPSALNRLFEEKIRFAKHLKDWGIPQPPFRLGRMGMFEFDTLHEELGERLVIQLARGFAGSSTHMVEGKAAFLEFQAEYRDHLVKIVSHVEGLPITLNACVLPDRVLVSRPFYQITGDPAFNRYRGGTCGNDFAFDLGLPDGQLAEVERLAERIGQAMQAEGYRGIFGLDLIASPSDGSVYVIEDNARLVASIPFFTQLQWMHQEVPLVVWHLASLLGIEVEADWAEVRAGLQRQRQAAQLILRNTADEPQVVVGDMPGGVVNGEGQLMREGYRFQGLQRGESLVHRAAQGFVAGVNIEYASLQQACGMIAPDQTIKPEIRQMAERIKRQMLTHHAVETEPDRG